MSHFTVGVIVPRTTRDVNGYLEQQMAPFDEGLEVPEYERPCYCVGRDAQAHGEQMARKLVGTWDERRTLFHALPAVVAYKQEAPPDVWDDQVINKMWRDFNRDFKQASRETSEDYAMYHPAWGQPRPDCEECHGSGVRWSTYNPKSKWDWYRVGGRWDGDLTLTPQKSGNGFNFDKKHETLSNNSVPVTELFERYTATGEVYTFFAIITPDGAWHDRGRMGWVAMVSDEQDKEVWQGQLLRLYRQYADHDVVLLDAHI